MTDCNHPKATLRQGTESLLRCTHKGEQLLSKRERKGDNSLWDDGGYSVRGGGSVFFSVLGRELFILFYRWLCWNSHTSHMTIPWPSMTFYLSVIGPHSIPWFSKVFFDIPWPSVTFHDLPSTFLPQVSMGFYGLTES